MRPFLAFLIFISSLRADPLAGAWETFPTESNANAWLLYSFSDGISAPPSWVAPDFDPGGNPYAYSLFLGGEGVWFYADEFTARGAFAGDYAAQKISGVDVSVSIDPAEIDYIDLVVYADGPLGPGYYYSLTYLPEDIGEVPDWYELGFRFDENWFSLENGVFTAFRPDQGFLSSIEEVGLRVFPVAGVGEDAFVGMDDFILVPTVEAPTTGNSLVGGNFRLDFTLNPGVSATIQKLSPDFMWKPIPGETGLVGSQVFTTPVVPGTALFRVAAKEKLTQVISP